MYINQLDKRTINLILVLLLIDAVMNDWEFCQNDILNSKIYDIYKMGNDDIDRILENVL